jgi:deoxyadenosine/deoxycytidine kinase
MVIILEGMNGSGKSTYAHELSSRLNIPLYHVFKNGNTDIHYGDQSKYEKMLINDFKVPLNTHIDDLYVADMVTNLGVSVIMDRSLPSAIAYGIPQACPYLPMDTKALLDFWQGFFGRSSAKRVLYVWMRVSYEVAKSRIGHRQHPNKNKWVKIEKSYSKLFNLITLPKIAIDTDVVEVADGMKRILALGVKGNGPW